jgi:hypothetical protein
MMSMLVALPKKLLSRFCADDAPGPGCGTFFGAVSSPES